MSVFGGGSEQNIPTFCGELSAESSTRDLRATTKCARSIFDGSLKLSVITGAETERDGKAVVKVCLRGILAHQARPRIIREKLSLRTKKGTEQCH